MPLPLIIVPAAGNSKRFKDAGINTPKGLIEFSYARGRPRHMVKHVIPYDVEKYLIVTNDPAYSRTHALAGSIFEIGASKGQAHTVALSCSQLYDQPILVINSDVMCDYSLQVFVEQCRWAAAGVLVFEGHNNLAYSYVDQYPLFTCAREKKPISKWAIAGIYWFRSSKQLAEAVHTQMDRGDTHANEFYLSNTLQYIRGEKVAIVAEREQLHGWDTPEDLARDPEVKVTDPEIEKILATLR